MVNATPDPIIIGDFNRHSHLWDPIQKPGAWGNELEKRIYDLDSHVPKMDHPTEQVASLETTALLIYPSVAGELS